MDEGESALKGFLSRSAMVDRLKDQRFDILVIGGGATGAGAVLDAATRGLKVALVEANDFASGTSSRSTKLVHGGVRYLENAVKKLDVKEYELVRDALCERQYFLNNAPHLTNPLPILTPVYSWFEASYYLAGLKLYDIVAGNSSLGASVFLSKSTALARFPMLKKQGLKGAVVYYDGQFDDARMNVSVVLTALREGALALNYIKVVDLIRKGGKIVGAQVQDGVTQQTWDVYAKVVINAAGPFAESIRKMDDKRAPDIISISQGTHVLLPKKFSPPDYGLVIPKTADGRVLFLLPWLGKTLAGTTDWPQAISAEPKATDEEVEYILSHLRQYFDVPLKRTDVMAAWSGLRPLVKPPRELGATSLISRDHLIEVTPSKLVTIVGGKWTTYRKMGQDVVDMAIKVANLTPLSGSKTKKLKLIGAGFFKESKVQELQNLSKIDADIAEHLVKSYGDRAGELIDIDNKARQDRLLEDYPFVEAEVIYALRYEYAIHASDILARRMRLAFLDNQAARKALPKVISLMAQELKWNTAMIRQEFIKANEFLDTLFCKATG